MLLGPRRQWLLGAGALVSGCASRRAAPSSTAAPAPPQAPPTPEAPAATDPLAALSWLAGTWVSEAAAGPRTIEHWLAPDGGMMLGVNRTVEHGRAVFFEYLRIVSDDAGVAYLASPLGRDPPTRFDLVEPSDRSVTFGNPTHDFPQRIEYAREGDQLTMTISGEEGGAARSERWTMRRADATTP